MVEDTGLERYVVNLGAFLTSAGVSTRHSLLGVVRGCSCLFVVVQDNRVRTFCKGQRKRLP